MSGTTETASDLDVTGGGLGDALGLGWRLLVRVVLAVAVLAWAGFWADVAYINVTTANYLGSVLTVGLLVGTLWTLWLAWCV